VVSQIVYISAVGGHCHRDLYHTNIGLVNPLPPSDAVPKQKKNFLEDLLSLVLSRLKKYHYSGNLKFNYFGFFQSLKLRNFNGKNPFDSS